MCIPTRWADAELGAIQVMCCGGGVRCAVCDVRRCGGGAFKHCMPRKAALPCLPALSLEPHTLRWLCLVSNRGVVAASVRRQALGFIFRDYYCHDGFAAAVQRGAGLLLFNVDGLQLHPSSSLPCPSSSPPSLPPSSSAPPPPPPPRPPSCSSFGRRKANLAGCASYSGAYSRAHQ